MGYQEDIDKALRAHGAWKQRLNAAIASGGSEFEVGQVRTDNHCEFGKWFYSLPNDVRESDICSKIRMLHADFHAEAAQILELALKGKKDDAQRALDAGGRYTSISGQLTIALNRWRQSLSGMRMTL